MPDQLKIALCVEPSARILIVDATFVAERARVQHQLTGAMVKYNAQAMIASVLLSNQIKGEERMSVQIQTEDPFIAFTCDVTSQGQIRARIRPIHKNLFSPLTGVLMTMKHNAQRELYRGVTEITEQSIAEALQLHLSNSSQIPAFLHIDVDSDHSKVHRALGVLVEHLPLGAITSEADKAHFEEVYSGLSQQSMKTLSEQLDRQQLCGKTIEVVNETPLVWWCTCSQQRTEQILCSLGVSELHSLIEEQGGAQVTCRFCNEEYNVSAKRLEQLIKIIESDETGT